MNNTILRVRVKPAYIEIIGEGEDVNEREASAIKKEICKYYDEILIHIKESDDETFDGANIVIDLDDLYDFDDDLDEVLVDGVFGVFEGCLWNQVCYEIQDEMSEFMADYRIILKDFDWEIATDLVRDYKLALMGL